MSRPLVVTVPHNLGKEEARRRLQGGVGQLHAQFGDKIGRIEDSWTGDRMDFGIVALGQRVEGHLEVAEDSVRVEVKLPWLLSLVAEKAKALIEKQGRLMLGKR